MNQRLGTCSLCGGDVYGFIGPWLSVTPPPPARCYGCGAVSASDVIKMYRPTDLPGTTIPTKLGDNTC